MKLARSVVFLCFIVVLFAGCASTKITKAADIPPGSEITIISFRDCMITGQDEDCNGSGQKTAEAFRDSFSQGGKFRSSIAPRPVGPKEPLSDAAAAEYGRKNNYPYVINGEVDDFYSVAAMTFRSDKAAVSVRVIRSSDSLVITSFSKPGTAGSNFETPQGMMKRLADELRNAL